MLGVPDGPLTPLTGDEEKVVCTKESERESDGEHRFKPCEAGADWLTGGREDHWTRVMMSVLRLTVWETSSHVKNRKAA